MAKSLQSTRTPQAIVGEFIQRWRTPQNINKTLVLVEGQSDRIFYYKFFNCKNSSIETCGGCRSMKDIHMLLQQQDVITHFAIKDSDFARLESIPPYSDNMFYADAHDYEMMCLRNMEIRKELFANLAFPYEERLVTEILGHLAFLSYFKWYNYANHCNHVFKGNVPVDGTISLDSYNDIHARSCCKRTSIPIKKSDLDAFIAEHLDPEPYEFVNGHDFIECLCCRLKKEDASLFNNLNEEKLKHTLHPCFHLEDFAETELCQSIQNWEKINAKEVLVKN